MQDHLVWYDIKISDLKLNKNSSQQDILNALQTIPFIESVEIDTSDCLTYDKGEIFINKKKNSSNNIWLSLTFQYDFVSDIKIKIRHYSNSNFLLTEIEKPGDSRTAILLDPSIDKKVGFKEINLQTLVKNRFQENGSFVTDLITESKISLVTKETTEINEMGLSSISNNLHYYSVPYYYINNHRIAGCGNKTTIIDRNNNTGYNYDKKLGKIDYNFLRYEQGETNSDLKYWNFGGYPYILYNDFYRNFYTDPNRSSISIDKTQNIGAFKNFFPEWEIEDNYNIINIDQYDLLKYQIFPSQNIINTDLTNLTIQPEAITRSIYTNLIPIDIKITGTRIKDTIVNRNDDQIECVWISTQKEDKNLFNQQIWRSLFDRQDIKLTLDLNQFIKNESKIFASTPTINYGTANFKLRNFNFILPSFNVIFKNMPVIKPEYVNNIKITQTLDWKENVDTGARKLFPLKYQQSIGIKHNGLVDFIRLTGKTIMATNGDHYKTERDHFLLEEYPWNNSKIKDNDTSYFLEQTEYPFTYTKDTPIKSVGLLSANTNINFMSNKYPQPYLMELPIAIEFDIHGSYHPGLMYVLWSKSNQKPEITGYQINWDEEKQVNYYTIYNYTKIHLLYESETKDITLKNGIIILKQLTEDEREYAFLEIVQMDQNIFNVFIGDTWGGSKSYSFFKKIPAGGNYIDYAYN